MFQVVDATGVAGNLSNVELAPEEVQGLNQSQGRHYVCFFEGNMLHWAYFSSEIREVPKGRSTTGGQVNVTIPPPARQLLCRLAQIHKSTNNS